MIREIYCMLNSLKHLRLTFLFLSLSLFSCANIAETAKGGDMNFSGEITQQALFTEYPKFAQVFDKYQPDSSEVDNFKRLADFDLIVFFGVWCHDSQREVPRLLKLIHDSGVQLNSLTLVAIDQQKTVPEPYQANYPVQFTPTFFVAKDNQVLAKMVEKPKQSITQDLLAQILH